MVACPLRDNKSTLDQKQYKTAAEKGTWGNNFIWIKK